MEEDEILKAKLNGECGQIAWPELQRHFARGVVINVDEGMDLIDVAVQFSKDNQLQVSTWLEQGKVRRANDDDARDWQANDPLFWAIVVAPWVLVQPDTRQS